MPKKALASLNVVINAVTTPLFRGLNKASKRLVTFGAKMQTIGRSITTSFALPFAAVGVAGAKMAIDFEKSMTKINTLVGISSKEVKNLSGDVMKLAGTTAQAPAELAEGLFFLTSAGLRGADAMKALEQVSKGVAIGLGEQADLAKVAAAAQNAYGADTVDSTQALDQFAMAVRTGMFESSELAESLGTQVGLAAELGISFKELLANISTYTKTTGDARSATTGFGGVMMAVTKPTEKGRKALDEINMSYESLRRMVQDEGLAATLFHLKDAFAANGVEMSDLFGKSQAIKNIMGTLGEQGDTYIQILDNMEESSGALNEGFESLEQTAGFKMQKSFNTLKMAVQDLGTTMMPIFTQIVEGAVKIAKGFTSLDTGQKQLVLAAGTLVAFSGPLMTMAGGVTKALGMMTGPVGMVVVALGIMFAVIYDNWEKIKPVFVAFINYWIDLWNESEAFRRLVLSIGAAFKTIWAFIKFFFKALYQQILNLRDFGGKVFDGLGKLIAGAFTLDFDLGKEGYEQMMEFGEGMRRGMDEIEGDFLDEMDDINKAFTEGMRMKDKVELVTEEQLDQAISDIETYMTDKMKAAKAKLQALFEGGTSVTPGGTSTEGGDPEDPEGGDPNELEGTLDDKLSKWQTYWNSVKLGMKNLGKYFKENYQTMMDSAQAILGGIGALWAAEHEKQMTIIENDQIRSQEAFDADYERELLAIENSKMSQEEKDKALIDLKKDFDDKQEDLDKGFADRKKAAETKQAKRNKAMNIANAIMGGANAVVQALTVPPPAGPILAAIVGGLAAAQVAVIASTPIPLAQGGIAFGPTNALVGEYPGASTDPEVVAPLSKLKSMLGNQMNVQLQVGGVLKGEDIYLSNDLATTQRERYI
jgi:TP901 family phage tail tape measure protein